MLIQLDSLANSFVASEVPNPYKFHKRNAFVITNSRDVCQNNVTIFCRSL
jgi:hypothetical protein